MKCEVCQTQDPSWAWTDTRGVAQCFKCGTPHIIYHYEEIDGKPTRVDKPPQILVKPGYIAAYRAYWDAHHRRIPSMCSFDGGQELATRSDADAFYAWMEANAKEDADA